MVKPTNVFNDVMVTIRDELREGDKRAVKSKTPKFGEGDRRKNRNIDPLAQFMKQNKIQKQFLRMGAGLDQ